MKKLAVPVITAALITSLAVPVMAEGLSLSVTDSKIVTDTAKPTSMTETASPTSSKIYVNGKLTGFDAYNIKGNNYFKLRDVAYALSGTNNQFNVIWDANAGEIKLISKQAYAKVGSLNKGSGTKKTATLNTAPIMKDNNYVSMTAYTLEGNNYFKLRDLGNQFGFTVGWSPLANAVTIETSDYVTMMEEQVTGTSWYEGGKHNPAKAGDTVIKADGTKVVLKETKFGAFSLLGFGQNVDTVTGTVINGVTAKPGLRAWSGYDPVNNDRSTFIKDPITGCVFTENQWMAVMNYNVPTYDGTYDGQVANVYYMWDSILGSWTWQGPTGN